MIVSGDDVAYPVIAFSPTGTYSEQNRPIQFEEWMEGVKKDISSAIKAKNAPLPKAEAAWRHFNVSADSFALDDFSAVAEGDLATASAGPLLSTEWGQSTYYNDYCPVDYDGPDDHALVGCVAVAMAQVMKYHNFPETGSGSHSYSHPTYGTLSANFGSTTYDWDSMPDSLSDYDSDVAELLYHVGVSVEMDYGPSGSGASTGATATALKTYFNYNDTASYVRKSDYSGDDWTALLREEINNDRPVIYRGSDIYTGGGHAFVCDGYSGSDYFHFNWGWYGSYQDEYFYLNDLTPGSHDYSDSQAAVVGIAPDINDPPVGYFDSAGCSSFSGWAKDPDITDPINIHFYVDGPAGTGTFIGGISADVYRGDLPYDDKNHGFSFATPESLKDGQSHQIYVYALDDQGGTNPLLNNSPKSIQCTPVNPPPIGNFSWPLFLPAIIGGSRTSAPETFSCADRGLPGPEVVSWQGRDWQRCDDEEYYNWSEAIAYCENLTLNGYDDWRLPAKDELKGLVVCSNGTLTPLQDYGSCQDGNNLPYDTPTIDGSFECSSDCFWSSSAYNQFNSWYVCFSNGFAGSWGRPVDDYFRVRCVR